MNRRQALQALFCSTLHASAAVVASATLRAEEIARPAEGDLLERADALACRPPAAGETEPVAFLNGGFRNGGFRKGGFLNGGFRNGGFRNGGFVNGGFRNGGFRNW